MAETPHSCELCGAEEPVYLSPRCHPGSALFCLLDGDLLTLKCAACGRVVSHLRVAKEPLREEEARIKP